MRNLTFSLYRTLAQMAMLAVGGAALCVPFWANAQSDAQLKMIVPAAAGSPPDVNARLVADQLRVVLGHPVVVINKSGAGGILAAQEALASPRDGSTVLWAANSLFGINPFVFRKLPYTLEQFEPVSNVVEVCLTVVARHGLGVMSLEQLINRMKAEPGKVNFAAAGIGNQPILTWEKLLKDTGTKATTVPYKSAPEVMTGMLGGHSDVTVNVLSGTDLQNFQAGKTIPLAVTCRDRVSHIPEVPTMIEAGLPDLTTYGSYQLHYAKGVPPEAVERMAKAVEQVKRQPEYVQKLASLYAKPAPQSTPAEFRRWLDADRASWSRVARELNVVIDN